MAHISSSLRSTHTILTELDGIFRRAQGDVVDGDDQGDGEKSGDEGAAGKLSEKFNRFQNEMGMVSDVFEGLGKVLSRYEGFGFGRNV